MAQVNSKFFSVRQSDPDPRVGGSETDVESSWSGKPSLAFLGKVLSDLMGQQSAEILHRADQWFDQLFEIFDLLQQGAPTSVRKLEESSYLLASVDPLVTSVGSTGERSAAGTGAETAANVRQHIEPFRLEDTALEMLERKATVGAIVELAGERLAEIKHSLDRRFVHLQATIEAKLKDQLPAKQMSDPSSPGQQRELESSVWAVRRRSPIGDRNKKERVSAGENAPVQDQSARAIETGSATPVTAGHGYVTGHRKDQPIAEEDFLTGWAGRAWAQDGTELGPNGGVRAKRKLKQLGFVSRTFDLVGGGLFEIETFGKVIRGNDLVVRVVNEAGEGIGPDFVKTAQQSFRAFAPARTRKIKIYVLMLDAEADFYFAIERLVLRRLDSDHHQRRVSQVVGEPVLASLASIPSRQDMLSDCVASLVAQCDRVRVFLNNYPDIPDFLKHPRIEVRRSQDWDDRGDAGKVFWLDRDETPGYRLIVDDDLIFPPDFAEVMCAKVAAKGRKAIYAAHGVLLRQPVTNYYDNQSRAATFHFARELPADRRVHIGATNALCLHSGAISMRWADFMYCNSADIWLALYAQKEGLQILTPARPRDWIRENRHAAPDETIYKHSLNRTRTRFDSSLVQDSVLKFNWPLTIMSGEEPKYCVLASFTKTEGLGEQISKMIGLLPGSVEWVVMLAYDRTCRALESSVAGVKLERETHLIDTSGDSGGWSQAKTLLRQLGLTAILFVDGDTLVVDSGGLATVSMPHKWGGICIVKLERAERKVVGAVLTESGANFDTLQSVLGPIPLSASEEASQNYEMLLRRCKELDIAAPASVGEPTVNSVFKRVRVLNLDRRPDRWESVSKSLHRAGIAAERFSAIDGSAAGIRTEYQRYLEQPVVSVSPDLPAIRYQRDLYMGYVSQMARVAYLERDGKKAIVSSGAWGYLKSYEAILEQALAEGTESLLVFDDDVLLHKNIKELFTKAMEQIPQDWLILQFGTLQYNWSPPWAEAHSPMLYKTNGSAVGSHAVGMRFEVIPYLLDNVRRFDLPYDIGALSAATRAFSDRCFVVSPNLAIQSMVDSDIGTSDFQKSKRREDAAATYRWKLDDYE